MPPLDLADLNVAQGRHQLGIVCAYPLKTTRVLQLQHGTIRLMGVLALPSEPLKGHGHVFASV